MDNKEHWENVGGAYSESWASPAKRILSQRELAFIERHIHATVARDALDVGIGNGRIIDRLISSTQATRFYGVDIAGEMVRVCQRRFDGEPRVKGLYEWDVSDLRLPVSEQFDFISAIRVLKYSENWADIVGFLLRSLRPGGVLVFSIPNSASINRLSRPYDVPWQASSPAGLSQLLAGQGAEVLEVAGFVRLPYFLYERPRRPRLGALVAGIDSALSRLIGDELLVRELFVAARRPGEPGTAVS